MTFGAGAGRGRGDERSGARPADTRPAVLVDRDGTLIHERHYLSDPAGVELIPGAAAALRTLADAGYALVVVTNQSGIARGRVTPEQYAAVRDRVATLLAREDVRLDGVYHCPHHPELTGPCTCRKPAPGLYLQAAAELGLDLARSHFIGDKLGDVLPARAFGGGGYLVRTGYGAEQAARAPDGVRIVDDLAAAARWILAGRSG